MEVKFWTLHVKTAPNRKFVKMHTRLVWSGRNGLKNTGENYTKNTEQNKDYDRPGKPGRLFYCLRFKMVQDGFKMKKSS